MKWIKNSKWNRALKAIVCTYTNNTHAFMHYRMTPNNPVLNRVYWTFRGENGKCNSEEEAQDLLIGKLVLERIITTTAPESKWSDAAWTPRGLTIGEQYMYYDKLRPFS